MSQNGVAQILHLCSVVFEQHGLIPVEGSCPPETDAVSFFVLAINLPMQLQFWRRSGRWSAIARWTGLMKMYVYVYVYVCVCVYAYVYVYVYV